MCKWVSRIWYKTLTQTCLGPNFPPTTSSWKDLLESRYSPMHVAQLQWHSYPVEDAGMTPTFHQCICSLQDLCSAAAGTAVSPDQTGVPMCPQLKNTCNRYIKSFSVLLHLPFMYIKMTSLYSDCNLSVIRTSGVNIAHSEFPYFLKRSQLYCKLLLCLTLLYRGT
jgi:hypothetical protein